MHTASSTLEEEAETVKLIATENRTATPRGWEVGGRGMVKGQTTCKGFVVVRMHRTSG